MPGDKKVTVEVSEALVEAVKKLQAALDAGVNELQREGVLDWENVAGSVESAAGELERDATRRLLQECDLDAESIRVNGKRTRVGRHPAPYFTKAGEVSVERSLYREDGRRNAKTVDAVSLRTGALDGWSPATIRAVAFLVQQTTSREAAEAAAKLGRLPSSRSSFERVTHQLGALYDLERKRVEDTLIEKYEPPEKAVAISAQLDRFAVAMEEPKPRRPGRPPKNAPARPIEVKWHMAFSGTVSLHAKDGEALETIKYGRMPNASAEEVAAVLKEDPEFGREDLEVTDLIDIWHVVEKLSPAAQVIFDEGTAVRTLEQWKLRLLNSRHARGQIYEVLRASGREYDRVGEEAPVHDAMTYLANQAGRKGYAAARAQGLPIGSGTVEATCKSFALRMRRPGARWLDETGQHLLDLRALALSARFDSAIALTLAPLRATVRRGRGWRVWETSSPSASRLSRRGASGQPGELREEQRARLGRRQHPRAGLGLERRGHVPAAHEVEGLYVELVGVGLVHRSGHHLGEREALRQRAPERVLQGGVVREAPLHRPGHVDEVRLGRVVHQPAAHHLARLSGPLQAACHLHAVQRHRPTEAVVRQPRVAAEAGQLRERVRDVFDDERGRLRRQRIDPPSRGGLDLGRHLPAQHLLEAGRQVRHGVAFHRALQALAGAAPVGAGDDEQGDQLRLVAGQEEPLGVGLGVELQQIEIAEVLVQLALLGGGVEALAGLAPRRADVDDQGAAVGSGRGALLRDEGRELIGRGGLRVHEAHVALRLRLGGLRVGRRSGAPAAARDGEDEDDGRPPQGGVHDLVESRGQGPAKEA